MKIHVRRRHIVKGRRGDSGSCPIALACTEALKDVVRVGYSRAWVRDKASRQLSSTAMRFIARFDAGKPVKPFAFVLK